MFGSLQKPIRLNDLEDILRKATNSEHALIAETLKEVIRNDELILNFQPKVALSGADASRVVGVEALVR